LKVLLLKSNKIEDLFALDGILSLQELEDFQMQRNPLQEAIGEIEARLILVARFPWLKRLNGSAITASELSQAEIHYLAHFAQQVAREGPSKHPRWAALVEKYGAPVVAAPEVERKVRATVEFCYGDERIRKTIPLSMKVGALSGNVARLMKLKQTEIELAIENGNYQTYLPYPEQSLAEVGCVDGSIIRVGRIGDHLFDVARQAKSFKIRSISEHITEPE
jgi:hypothetical protein